MSALAIAQQRHDAAQPPSYYAGDDLVDTMLATDPAFAFTGENLYQDKGEFSDKALRIEAELQSKFMDSTTKKQRARAALELANYVESQFIKLYRHQAEKKHAELTEDYA